MIYSNSRLRQQQQQNSLLLNNEEAKMFNFNDKLLLPSSTRSLKRRTSLLEKSRDWARRFITLHRPRRNTISNEKFCDTSSELNKTPIKNYDEDGYLSPLEIKAKLDNINQENRNYHNHDESNFKSSTIIRNPNIYRYYDPNIQRKKRYPTTSFVSEFQKSLSIVDYIDIDISDDLAKQEDDPLESLKYLFSNNHNNNNITRRIPRRPTNVSSISTDSGYSDIPISSSSPSSSSPLSSKIIPVHLISCSLIPVNVRCLTCTCRPSSTTCLTNEKERKFYSHSSRSPLLNTNKIENGMKKSCICHNKYHSTMTIATKNEDEYYQQKKHLRKRRANLLRHPTITDDLISISRWYKPYLERDSVCNVLQQSDYGAFILRNSTTHSNCYALSIKVPKFTHDSNIVHYLIEKTLLNSTPSYRIKGTLKQFPTLLSLLTHHSVMPEILPITLNLNESFTI